MKYKSSGSKITLVLASSYRHFAVGVAFVVSFSYATVQAQSIHFEALATKGGKQADASCVALDTEGTLVTVVELGADMKKATWVDGEKKIPLTFVVNDLNSRLAIYKLPEESKSLALSPAEMGRSSSLVSGQEIFASVKKGGAPARVVARVGRFQGKVLPLAVIRVNHSKPVPRPGSGMYDADGKLVGVIRQSVFGSATSSYCLPVEVIQRTLIDFQRHGQVRRCWIGIVMDELVAPPIVESIRPNSPAQKAGLKKGDVILRIGAQNVSAYAEVVDAFFYLIAGEAKIFKILRGAEIKKIKVIPEVNPSIKK